MYIEQSELEEKLEGFIEQSYDLCLLLQRIGKWQAAIRLLVLGIDWAEDVLQKARLQIILGEIYIRQARYDEAEDLLEAALKCANDKIRSLESDGHGTSSPYENDSDTQNKMSGAHGDAPLQIADYKLVVAKALFALGELHYFRYVFRQDDEIFVAQDYIQKAQELYEELDDFRGMVAVLTRLGIMQDNQGNEAAAREYYERAIALADKHHDEAIKIMALAHLGIVYMRNGDFEEALYYHEMSLDISQQVGQADRIMHALGHIAIIKYNWFGDLKLALFKCKEALKIAEKLGHQSGMCLMLKRLGGLELEAGNLAEAQSYFGQLKTVAEDNGFKRYAEMAGTQLKQLTN